MDTTSFLAATIQRIARKRLTATLFWLGAIALAFLCSLGLLWLMKFPWIAYLFMVVIGLIVCGLAARSAHALARASRNPLESFFLSDLKPYGPLQPTIAQIDEDAAPYVGKIGSFVTRHWIISALSNSLSFMRLEDVVWIYKHRAESSVSLYGAVTVAKSSSCAAEIWSRFGYPLHISSTETGVDGLLAQIGKAVPWVTQGYTPILAEAWNQRRAEFLAAVDRRRRQILFLDSGESGEGSAYGLPGSSQNPLLPFGMNDPANQELLDALHARQDRQTRAVGCLILSIGLVLSALFILPLLRGGLESEGNTSTFRMWVVMSLAFLGAGLYYLVLGRKARRF